jgi:hypothetical protein
MISEDDCGRLTRKGEAKYWPTSRHYPVICSLRVRKTMKTFVRTTDTPVQIRTGNLPITSHRLYGTALPLGSFYYSDRTQQDTKNDVLKHPPNLIIKRKFTLLLAPMSLR